MGNLSRGQALALAFVFACGSAAAAETPLERGAYLMRSVVACGNCHTMQTPEGPDDSRELAGGPPIEEAGVFTAYPPNITPDPETGIGNWTDEQIITAIREGTRPDGTIIGPPMPILLYRGLSDGDAKALVAYLRSVKPLVNKAPKSEYHIPLPPSYGPPVGSVPEVSTEDKAAYGAYLAGPLAHCIECHSPPALNGAPDIENQLGAGGMAFHGPWGVSYSANITPTGIGDWTDDQIKTAITAGVRPDGSQLMPPMGIAYYRTMRDEDLDALVAYLRSLPPK
jgi:mono/diheme cytochrome c family protein